MILRNLQIVNGLHTPITGPTDLALRNGRIAQIGSGISPLSDAEPVLDLPGAFATPGWFDLGCASGDPGYEHREDLDSLCAAALEGGFTALAPMPNTSPAIHAKAEVRYVLDKTAHSRVRCYPLGALSRDCAGKDLAELYDMQRAGAAAFTDGLNPVQDAGLLLRALQYAQAFDGLIMNTPRNQALAAGGQMHESGLSALLGLRGQPDIAETIALQRDLRLLEYAGGRLHAHLIACAESVRLIRQAKAQGLQVTASVALANLCFTEEKMASFDSLWKVMPPLRSEADREALIEGVCDGTLDVVCTNHNPWHEEAKNLEFTYAEFGMSALETAAPLYQTYLAAHIPLPLWVERIALAPRRILGLPLPLVAVGEVADLTVFDPTRTVVLLPEQARSRGLNTPFWGQTLQGKAFVPVD